MHRKGLVIGILILMLGVNIGSTFAGDVDAKTMSSVSFDGNTLYVGGNGPGNYTKIQDAIDNASNGDTVYVYNGTYYGQCGQVKIYKSITLIGEDRDTTIIDGDGIRDVVYISADWVNISGFTIRNSGESWGYAGIAIRSNYNTITGNIIGSNEYGIDLYHSNFNTITGNIISSNNGDGIRLADSKSNTIRGNTIQSNNEYGIFFCWDSSKNTITNNTISNKIGGLYLHRSENNIIEKNNFIRSRIHVFFWLAWRNTWDSNYWDNWIGFGPKLIFGFLGLNFDWNPASEPYDIGV